MEDVNIYWFWLYGVVGLCCGYLMAGAAATVKRRAREAVLRNAELKALLAVADALYALEAAQGKVEGITMIEEEDIMEAAIASCRAALSGPGHPMFTHRVRGSTYALLSEQLHFNSSSRPPVQDGDMFTLYIDTATGRLCCRHVVEFYDGRFARVVAGEGVPPGPSYIDPDRDLLDRMKGI